ncbi:MAG: NUDIX domain-containing protein [Gammaproteobacteria bacterium]|nr:NUDIX domain-containing protein [Gammaproteobacteria bacterium]
MKPRILSAGAVIVRPTDTGPRILLLRAYNYWDFPKGVVEPGETPLEAAHREVAEETGIEQLVQPWGELYRETAPYGKGKVARYYLAITTQTSITLSINPELGRPEHHEYRWATPEEARELISGRLLPILDWALHQIGIKNVLDTPQSRHQD